MDSNFHLFTVIFYYYKKQIIEKIICYIVSVLNPFLSLCVTFGKDWSGLTRKIIILLYCLWVIMLKWHLHKWPLVVSKWTLKKISCCCYCWMFRWGHCGEEINKKLAAVERSLSFGLFARNAFQHAINIVIIGHIWTETMIFSLT